MARRTRRPITRLMEHMGSDELLLFSTDYPHWQFDGTDAIPAGLDPALAQKIMVDNPLRTYARLEGGPSHERGRPEPHRHPAAEPVEAGDRRLRHPSAPGRRRHRRGQQGAVSLSVEALAGACARPSASAIASLGRRGRPIRRASRRHAGAMRGRTATIPAAISAFMAEQHLDPNNVALGILNPLTSGQGAQNPRPVGRADPCHQ